MEFGISKGTVATYGRCMSSGGSGAYTVLYAQLIKCVKEGCRCERFVQGRGQVEWKITEHL